MVKKRNNILGVTISLLLWITISSCVPRFIDNYLEVEAGTLPSSPEPKMSARTPVPEPTRQAPRPTSLPGTPMGDGVLTDEVGFAMQEHMHSFNGNLLVWCSYDGEGNSIWVYCGVDYQDPEQGMLIIVRKGTIWDRTGIEISLPDRSGKPEIVAAVGSRLIIDTEGGYRYFFDVPSGQFAENLDQTLPTMTPGPTPTAP